MIRINLLPVKASRKAEAGRQQLILFAAFLILQIWLGFFGNRLTARMLLHHGWTIDRPNDRGNKLVIEKWRLSA